MQEWITAVQLFSHHFLEIAAHALPMWPWQEKVKDGWRRNEGENGK